MGTSDIICVVLVLLAVISLSINIYLDLKTDLGSSRDINNVALFFVLIWVPLVLINIVQFSVLGLLITVVLCTLDGVLVFSKYK